MQQDIISNAALRKAIPAEQARLIQAALTDADSKTLSEHLLRSLENGAIPPSVYRVFLDVSHDAARVAEGLRQNFSVRARRVATLKFGQHMRTDQFDNMWKAIGGTSGLAELMAAMSVNEVRFLCSTIRKARAARSSVAQRQAAISELYQTLSTPTQNPDKRPLGHMYERLAPACTASVFLENIPVDYTADAQTLSAHTQALETRCLEKVLPDNGETGEDFSRYRCITHGRLDFALEVLERFSKSPTQLKANSEAFAQHLALPLARRLTRRREPVDVQNRFYRSLLESYKTQSTSGAAPSSEILYTAIGAWKTVPAESKPILGARITELLHLMDKSGSKLGTDEITTQLRNVHRRKRISLFKLLLPELTWRRSTDAAAGKRGEEIDVESPSNHDYLRSFGKYWDSKLLLSLPSDFSLNLFEALEAAWPASEIALGLDDPDVHSLGDSARSICSPCFLETDADRHVLWALLQSRRAEKREEQEENPPSPSDAEKKKWRDRLATLTEHYRSRAASQKDPRVRTLFATAVMHLAIASGSLETLKETLIWLRRFNRDPETVLRLYNWHRMRSDELLDLLSGFPVNGRGGGGVGGGKAISEEALAQNVDKSTEIQLLLMETMSQCAKEPFFKSRSASCVLNLPGKVVVRRAVIAASYSSSFSSSSLSSSSSSSSSFDISSYLWRPTISGLVKLEAYMHQNSKNPLFSASRASFGADAPNHAGGFLGVGDVDFPKKAHGPELFRFLDDLARERDMFWKGLRAERNPAVGKLAAPWPKGLPVQSLLPHLGGFLFQLSSTPESAFSSADDTWGSSPAGNGWGSAKRHGRRSKKAGKGRTSEVEMMAAAAENMPYLIHRAKEIVFMKQEVSLGGIPGSDDAEEDEEKTKETRAAIGGFVDSYSYAFKVYTTLGYSEERERTRAWEYAVDLLRKSVGPAASKEEAIRCCATVGISAPNEMSGVIAVSLPYEGGEGEWNPFRRRLEQASPWRKQSSKTGKGPLSCLDYMMAVDGSGQKTHASFTGSPLAAREDLPDVTSKTSFSASLSGPSFQDSEDAMLKMIWGSSSRMTSKSLSRMSVADKDSIMAEIFLRLHATNGDETSFMHEAFPNSRDQRFPGLHLHEDSARPQSMGVDYPGDLRHAESIILERLLPSIPPVLLEQLATSVMTKMESSTECENGHGDADDDGTGFRFVIKLIKFLIQGDRPGLASPLIRHVVTERREDSSWHRSLLNNGTLQRMPAKDATQLFHDISSTMRSKIAAQKTEDANLLAEDPKQKPGPPAVKVSTFKMIAQLISNGLFIDPASAHQVLTDMLSTDPHPDVRYAITQSLSQIMRTTEDTHLRRRIMEQVARDIVPIAALVNEGKPRISREWEQDPDNAELPIPPPETNLPPMLQLLLNIQINDSDRQDWMDLVMLPALEKSTNTHTLWLRQLAVRRDIDEQAFLSHIPRVPMHVDFLLQLFIHYPSHFPSPHDTFNTIVQLNSLQESGSNSEGDSSGVGLPVALRTAIETLKETPSIRDERSEILTHLGTLTTTQLQPVNRPVIILAELLRLHHPCSFSGSSSSLIETVQSYVSHQLASYLSSSSVNKFNALWSHLARPIPPVNDDNQNLYQDSILPVLSGALDELRKLSRAPSYAQACAKSERVPQGLPEEHVKALGLFWARWFCRSSSSSSFSSLSIPGEEEEEEEEDEKKTVNVEEWAEELRILLVEFVEDTSQGFWHDRIGNTRAEARRWMMTTTTTPADNNNNNNNNNRNKKAGFLVALGVSLGELEKVFAAPSSSSSSSSSSSNNRNKPSIPQMVMVDQAEWLICESEDPEDAKIVGRLRDMARSWEDSPNEWISERGGRLTEALEKGNGDQGKGWGGRRSDRRPPDWFRRYANKRGARGVRGGFRGGRGRGRGRGRGIW